MRFSEWDKEGWIINAEYFDTCLIPFTGLSGLESPPETVERLERLQAMIDILERYYRGRIVIYPAVQYLHYGESDIINEICHNVKSINFRYAVLLDGGGSLKPEEIYESDLVLVNTDFFSHNNPKDKMAALHKIQGLWHGADR